MYSEEPARAGALPQHIDNVRRSLLDFTCTLLDDPLRGLHLSEADRALIKQYRTIREDAETLRRGKDREAEWQTFFLGNFFSPLVKEMRGFGKKTDKTSPNPSPTG